MDVALNDLTEQTAVYGEECDSTMKKAADELLKTAQITWCECSFFEHLCSSTFIRQDAIAGVSKVVDNFGKAGIAANDIEPVLWTLCQKVRTQAVVS